MKIETKYKPGDHVYRWNKERQLFERNEIQEVSVVAKLNNLYSYVPEVKYKFQSDHKFYLETELYKTREDALESIDFVE